MFIVAQCSSRWGSRYGRSGKASWTEQSPRRADGTVAPLLTVG
jgi:hypothetical protein